MTGVDQQDSGARHWWQTRWFVIAATLIATVPLLWPDIPPLVDLPGHMGRYRVQLEAGNPATPWLAQWYNFHWQLIGNLGIDLLIIPLAPIFGLELAVKLIVIAIPALTVAGLLWIAREVHGRIPPTALFALPLAYSFPFHFGFVNFALSMALALNAFALWLRLARRDRLKLRAVLFVPLSCLLWVCHTYGWGALGVLAFSAEMIRQHDLRKDGITGHWVESWFRAGVGCIPLALPLVLMVLWRSGDHVGGETGDWFNWQAKISWVTMVLRDRWQGLRYRFGRGPVPHPVQGFPRSGDRIFAQPGAVGAVPAGRFHPAAPDRVRVGLRRHAAGAVLRRGGAGGAASAGRHLDPPRRDAGGDGAGVLPGAHRGNDGKLLALRPELRP